MQLSRLLVFRQFFATSFCRFRGPFKTFEQDSHLLVSTGTANKVKADRSSFAHTWFSSCTQPPSRSLMLEQIDKFKHFFTTFCRCISQGQGRGILEGPSAAPLRRSLPISMRHRQVEQMGTAGAWSNW